MPQDQTLESAVVELLSDASLGWLSIALVADVIAAGARFNDWMAVDGKRALSRDAILDTLEVYEDTSARCRAAIEHFKSTADVGELERTLGQALEILRANCQRKRQDP